MKRFIQVVLVSPLFIIGCNNAEKQQIKDLSAQDSALLQKNMVQDTTIMTYIKSFNEIEANLDTVKAKEKMLQINNGESVDQKENIVSDIRSIGALMLKNKRQIAYLEYRLRKSNGKNQELQKMIAHLTEELNEKDAQIASLQSQLAESNASLKDEIQKFNDSMETISKQKGEISTMTTDMNTVYYAIGTMKELKQKGVVTREGGIAGIGSTAELKKDFNTSYFTKADLTNLKTLPLYSKFEKLVTNHPTDSYSITGSKKSDSLLIKDSKAFWSQSKYLVVIVK